MHNVQGEDLFVIGICGKAGAGKTAFAKYIIEQFLSLTDNKIGCTIVPFARALKDMALDMGWDGKKDEKGRRLLQLLGTDVCRDCIDENYWVKKWRDALIRETTKGIQLIIADDVRFGNEVLCINELGGHIYHVVGRAYNLKGEAEAHPSENSLITKNMNRIDNSSTFEALECRAIDVVKGLIKWTY